MVYLLNQLSNILMQQNLSAMKDAVHNAHKH